MIITKTKLFTKLCLGLFLSMPLTSLSGSQVPSNSSLSTTIALGMAALGAVLVINKATQSINAKLEDLSGFKTQKPKDYLVLSRELLVAYAKSQEQDFKDPADYSWLAQLSQRLFGTSTVKPL